MTYGDWAGLVVSVVTIVTAFVAAIRWLVAHYLNELKPNSGDSVKDRIIALESKVETMYQILIKER